MSGSIQQQFVSSYLPLAQQQSMATGIPVGNILAQSALETGWGQIAPGNNYFGISPGGSLASYGSAAESFAGYGSLLNSPRYSGVAAAAAGGPLAFGNAVQAAGYNPSPTYGYSIEALANEINPMLQGMGVNGNAVATGTGGAGGLPGTGANAGANAGAGNTAGGPVAGNSGGGPSLASDITRYLGRAAYLIVGIVLLAGALYLFGRRT